MKEVKLGKGRILEEFKDYVKMYNQPNDIVNFIAVTNARLLCECSNGLSDDKQKEIVEFVSYFMQHYYSDKVMKAIEQNWPDGPLVFRMAAVIIADSINLTQF